MSCNNKFLDLRPYNYPKTIFGDRCNLKFFFMNRLVKDVFLIE